MGLKERDLFEYIQQLNKSEKRYLRAFELKEGKVNYTRLFEFLERLEAYDKKEVKQYLSANFPPQTHGAIRSYLSKKILENNIRYTTQKSKNKRNEAVYLLQSAKILMKKGFRSSCLQFTEKAFSLCEEYDFFDIALQVLEFKISVLLMSNFSENSQWEEFNVLYTQQRKLQERQAGLNHYKFLYGQVNYFEQAKKYKPEDIARIEGDEFLSSPDRAVSILEKHCYYNIKALISSFRKEKIQVLNYFESCFQLWEQNPEMQKQYFSLYASLFYNYLYALIENGQYEKTEPLIPRFKTLHDTVQPYSGFSDIFLSMQLVLYRGIEIKSKVLQKDFSSVGSEFSALIKELDAHQQWLKYTPVKELFDTLLWALLRGRHFKEIERGLNSLETYIGAELLEDVKNHKDLIVYYLICLSENESYRFLSTEIRRFEYLYKKENEGDEIFETALNILRKSTGKRFLTNPDKTIRQLIDTLPETDENILGAKPEISNILYAWLFGKLKTQLSRGNS